MSDVTTYKQSKWGLLISPVHENAKNMDFNAGEEEEASLAHWVSVVGTKNGMSINDIFHVMPYVLRMLKSDCQWSK